MDKYGHNGHCVVKNHMDMRTCHCSHKIKIFLMRMGEDLEIMEHYITKSTGKGEAKQLK